MSYRDREYQITKEYAHMLLSSEDTRNKVSIVTKRNGTHEYTEYYLYPSYRYD